MSSRMRRSTPRQDPRLRSHTNSYRVVCEVAVDDEGPGINETEAPRLFERFYRGAEARNHPTGTGIGLSIVQGLLTALKGTVRIDNRPESGARFSIFVPAAGRAGVRGALKERAQIQSAGH